MGGTSNAELASVREAKQRLVDLGKERPAFAPAVGELASNPAVRNGLLLLAGALVGKRVLGRAAKSGPVIRVLLKAGIAAMPVVLPHALPILSSLVSAFLRPRPKRSGAGAEARARPTWRRTPHGPVA